MSFAIAVSSQATKKFTFRLTPNVICVWALLGKTPAYNLRMFPRLIDKKLRS